MCNNLGSKQELSSELIKKHKNNLTVSDLGGKFKRYEWNQSNQSRKECRWVVKRISFLRGGAKQAAFGSDVSPKVLVLAGMESANQFSIIYF